MHVRHRLTACWIEPGDRIYKLRQNLSGDAKESIEGYLLLSSTKRKKSRKKACYLGSEEHFLLSCKKFNTSDLNATDRIAFLERKDMCHSTRVIGLKIAKR